MNCSPKNILPTPHLLLAYCRNFGLLLLCVLFVSSTGMAQKSKKKKKKTRANYIHLAGGLQYGSLNNTYLFQNATRLNFTVITQRFNTRSSALQLGLGFQRMNPKFLFQEFGLTHVSLVRRFESTLIDWVESDFSEFGRGSTGIDFQIGFRYEVGKYFINETSAPINFGIGGALSPSYQFYKQTPVTSLGFPISFSRISLDAALIPRCAFRLSNRLALVAKVIPSFRLGSLFVGRAENPSIPIRAQTQTTFGESFAFNLAASVQISCLLQEPDHNEKRKKKRRRR